MVDFVVISVDLQLYVLVIQVKREAELLTDHVITGGELD